jgi:hypothetical protein
VNLPPGCASRDRQHFLYGGILSLPGPAQCIAHGGIPYDELLLAIQKQQDVVIRS